jgi:hypothetical protein
LQEKLVYSVLILFQILYYIQVLNNPSYWSSQPRFIGQNQANLMGQKGNLMATNIDPLFEQKLELATGGLEPHFLGHLKTKISPDNALTI